NEGHVNHFLMKPWDDEHLRTVVRDGVRAYQLILDNRRLEELTGKQKEELEAWNQRLEEQVEQRTAQLSTQNQRLQRLQRELEQSLRDTLHVMVAMCEASNPNIGIHSKRVAQHALTLGTQLSLTGDDLRDVEFAAHLHDIGKVSKLHAKKGSRSGRGSARSGGRSLRHSDSGCAILSHVTGFGGIAQAVRHQYENYDGTGYPDRSKEDEIPLISRIIAIADSYDETVFSSTSPTATSRGAGRKVLLAGQGKRFDPALVELFLEHLDKESDETCSDSEVELSPTQLKVGMKLSRPLQNSQGVLLLKSGTDLTAEMIERVKLAANIDPVLSGVFVKCTQEATKAVNGKQRHKGSDDTVSAGGSTNQVASDPSARSPQSEPGGSGRRGPCTTKGSSSVKQHEARKPKVLVVDDSNMLCNALQRELRMSGFDALTTNSGHDALALIQRDTFDVVITDVMMPAMGGEELLQRLGKLAPKLPCIVLTGNAKMDEVRRIAKGPNVAAILVKPWDKRRLMDTLKSAMARREAEPVKAS
ncbi:MAG: HD domain-containing phosphohydrolase, partial [Phycisphaerae bacterium]